MKVKPNLSHGGVTVELQTKDDPLLNRAFAPDAAAGRRFQLSRILVPVDFSAATQKALQYATAFAAQFEAKLVLLHVIEPTVVPDNFGIIPPAYDELNEELAQAARQHLSSLAESLRNVGNVEQQFRLGRPAWEITRFAEQTKADLIILATHGRTGLKHVLLGSVAELVVRHAPCPVLVVRDVEHDFVPTTGPDAAR
jgi:nucleotide-binding universal stress UspA family protein